MEIRDRKGTENLIADHLSRLENTQNLDSLPIFDDLPSEQLMNIQESVPWYADFVNYLACGVLPLDLYYQQKKKFFWDVKHYFWDEPYLYKRCGDGLIRRCVPVKEVTDILTHCHSLECGGHASSAKIDAKVLQSGFFCLSLFKDARECRRRGLVRAQVYSDRDTV